MELKQGGKPAEVIPTTEARRYLLEGEREHEASAECWCRPYQDEQNENVMIHNEMQSGRA